MSRTLIVASLALLAFASSAAVHDAFWVRYPHVTTMSALVCESVLRGQNEDSFHGMLLDLPISWEPSSLYERSAWMWSPGQATSELNEELEARRSVDPALAAKLDLNLASRLHWIAQLDPLAIWAEGERSLLKTYSASLERDADEAWATVSAVRSGSGLPIWATGRIAAYLKARTECDALGLAMVMELRTRGTPAHQKWQIREFQTMRTVASLDENSFRGAWKFDAAEYPSRIRMARKALNN